MKNWIKALLIGAILFVGFQETKASHIAGADISFECLGGDTFKIKLNVFRDCSGISAPTTVNVPITSPCGSVTANFVLTNPATPPTQWINAGTEVSQLCGTALPSSACNGGPFPGMVQLIFEAIVVLPPCNFWSMTYTPACCTNTNVNTNTSNSGTLVVQTTLNNSSDTCNTGPAFEAQPIPYVCAGQQVHYNFGTSEPDGDSLVYSFIAGFNGNINTPKIFNPPYSATAPIPGATINPKTGEVIFTATTIGNYVIVVKVEEYDPVTGQLISTTMRDILFVVQICSNAQPNPVAPIVNFSGTGSLVDSNSVEVCIGESFSFSIKIWDPNPNDSISIYSNVDNILPGAVWSFSYPHPTKRDTVLAHISWTAVPVNGTFYAFFVEANDNACPIPGLFYGTYDVRIVNSTYAYPSQTICKGTQQAPLNVAGGDQFIWSALPGGDPIVVGPPGVGNFSCDTCKYPIAYPSKTTCYQVVSNLSGSCNNTDTVCVYVAPNFEIDITDDTTICSVAQIQLSAVPSVPTLNYTFDWKPTKNMTNNKVFNPKVSPDQSTTYTVTIGSDSGCVKQESVTVTLSPPFPRNNILSATDTIICLQDTVTLGVELGDVSPAVCGISVGTSCVGNTSVKQVGSGTSQNSTTGINQWPTPFAGNNQSARQQFLYRAADLKAAGMQGGTITQMAFSIVQMIGPSTYNNYTIKMGCTNLNELTTNWVGGLVTVHTAKPVFPTAGWFTLPFDNEYNWDGNSNLIIEICFDNGGSGTSQSAIVQHSTKTYNATAFLGAQANTCNAFTQAAQSPINKLPNIRFTICQGADPNGFTYQWLNNPTNLVPPSSLSSQSIDVSVNLSTQPNIYTVAIADTFGVCFDTLTQRIHAVTQYDVTPEPAGPFCDISPYYFMKAFTPGGTWSGPGIIDDTLGLFDPGPSGAGLGTHWIKYEVTGDVCANKDSMQVQVILPPDPTITTLGPYCIKDTSVVITGVHPGFISSTNPYFAAAIKDSLGILDLSKLPNSFDSIIVTYNAVIPACINDSDFVIPLTKQFNPTIISPGTFCPHDSVVQLQKVATGGNWSGAGIIDSKLGLFDPTKFGPGTNTTVTLDSGGVCGNSSTITIYIDTLPDIYFTFDQGGPGPYCKNDGSVVVFNGNPINDPNVYGTGVWTHLNNWLLNITAFNTNNTLPAAGTHSSVYTFTDRNGCRNSDTITFAIGQAPPTPDGNTFFFCQGDYVDSLMVNINSSTVDTNNKFVWYEDPGLTSQIFTDSTYYQTPNNTGLANKLYYVVQISPEGCVSNGYGTVTAEIVEAPNVEFTANPVRGVDPLSVTFTNLTNTLTTTYPGVRWEWFLTHPQFGEQLIDSTENIVYDFEYDEFYNPAPGDSGFAEYYVLLKGYNQFGCRDTFRLRIVIDAVSTLVIPNIFTPNGDGFNDAFAPTISGMRQFEGAIFNRWGRKVAELTLENPTWDGRDPQSDQINDGVYYYVITAEGNSGQDFNEKGTVTLIKGNK